MQIRGKVAVVFGGARGIGLEYVSRLLQHGAKVCFSDVLEKEGCTAAMELSEAHPGCVCFLRCNITREQDIKDVFEKAKNYGTVEICINSAGICKENDWHRTMEVNYGGTVRITYEAFKHMGKDVGGAGGVIIHTASINGHRATIYAPVYTGTKHAIIGFIKAYGVPEHLAVLGVRVAAISPCMVLTPFQQEVEVVLGDQMQQIQEDMPDVSTAACADAMEQIIMDEEFNGRSLLVSARNGTFKAPREPEEDFYNNMW